VHAPNSPFGHLPLVICYCLLVTMSARTQQPLWQFEQLTEMTL
jgi:hypothetical protein